MAGFTQKGDYKKTESFLNSAGKIDVTAILHRYGREGVAALASATPVRSGLTANSWNYVIKNDKGTSTIEWINSNIQNGVSIAIILQYGHGTGTGGYVKGVDYINPAIKPIFDKMVDDIWREVTAK